MLVYTTTVNRACRLLSSIQESEYLHSYPEPGKLLNWLETVIRYCIERRTVGDLQLDAIEARVAQHDGPLSVIEPNRGSILKRVFDKLGAVGFLYCKAFYSSDDDVLPENIVFRPPRDQHLRLIGSEIKECVVPEQEKGQEPVILRVETS